MVSTQSRSKEGIAFKTLGNAKSGSGLVLIHGWGCQKSDYDGILDYLSRKQKAKSKLDLLTICPDLPGHGSTSIDVCPTPSIINFAKNIITLIQELGLKEIIIVGHSMGVRIVSEIWRLSQQERTTFQVSGIIFIDGSDYRTRPTIAFDKCDPRSASLTPEAVAALKAKIFGAMFSPKTPEAFKKSTIAHVASRDKVYSETLRDSMIAYDREMMSSTMETLGRAGNPVLVNLQSSDTGGVRGERRPMKKGELSKWMRYLEETAPQSRQVVVEDSAHFPHVDWPEIVGEEVWEVVREMRGS